MASNSCTFIIVPDATSQCKRYTVSKSVLWGIGISCTVTLVVLGVVVVLLLSEYNAVAVKSKQLAWLQKISSSQRSSIERYEQDISQVSRQLAGIRLLNSRLLVLTGLDPAATNGNDEMKGVGGGEEDGLESASEE
ncbi:hypothetical protein CSB45_08955 [candidate division KSB3 bacterium]|uniref:Cell division protein FtsL n=1 Tax=candidate division KSB3 bacterium TaxID=2044937 RepID=A0A2G6E4N6_9BACT|nr:MAG: hypothetical protein CSB45_08955 [candidate division KSB3 bacterium]PIE29657.1 MAG: hypothetical protein CSA57_07475 [candidate division KSB3 bacterium]